MTDGKTTSMTRRLTRELFLLAWVVMSIVMSTPLGVIAHLDGGHALDDHGHMVHVDDDGHDHGDVPCDDERGQSDTHCQTHLGTLAHAVAPVVVAPLDIAAADHVADAGRALDAHRAAAVWRLAPKTSPPQV